MMRTLMIEYFVDILKTRIQRSPLINIVLVIDDVGAYIQKHALEVHWVQHMIDIGDDQYCELKFTKLEIIMNNNINNLLKL